jgi:S-adenosyl-L-methionine methyltransferase
MRRFSRLEKLLYRLEAQHACLAWAFGEIKDRAGVVFELGLGHGRTFDHLRRHLPDRHILVFERKVDSYPDCTPDPSQLILGELAETLSDAARRFEGKVVLVHSDVGSFEPEHNSHMSGIIGSHLGPALAPGAIILSDLPLSIPGAHAVPLPPGAREDRYYIYRTGSG